METNTKSCTNCLENLRGWCSYYEEEAQQVCPHWRKKLTKEKVR